MTLLVAQERRISPWRTEENDIRWMSGEPRHIAAIARGEEDRHTGRTRPWQEVKEELGL